MYWLHTIHSHTYFNNWISYLNGFPRIGCSYTSDAFSFTSLFASLSYRFSHFVSSVFIASLHRLSVRRSFSFSPFDKCVEGKTTITSVSIPLTFSRTSVSIFTCVVIFYSNKHHRKAANNNKKKVCVYIATSEASTEIFSNYTTLMSTSKLVVLP